MNVLDFQMLALLTASTRMEDAGVLEHVLSAYSDLRGPRMNTTMVNSFAEMVGQVVTFPNPPVDYLAMMLDTWAAISPESAPSNDPREILPATAAAAYGQVAVMRPDWWEDEINKLRRAADDTRWRVRDMVAAAALEAMLKADWDRTTAALGDWLEDDRYYVLRAVPAALAEPRFYKDKSDPNGAAARAARAMSMMEVAAERLLNAPLERRRDEDVRCLRQALGYSISVVTVGAPDAGFALLERLGDSDDADARWVVLENLKKTRLNPWLERVQLLQMKLR